MKIAIPLADGRLSMHFGHCEAFALMEVDEQARTVTATTSVTPPGHAPGVLPAWLADQGATVIIASGMGSRAQQLFAQAGIEVVVGAQPEAPEVLASAWLEGRLTTGGNVCDH